MMKTFGEKVIEFNRSLHYSGKLPEGVSIMNPFRINEHVLDVSSQFYRKFYDDMNRRHLILGINPGRFGAAVTGVPFTDTKRLQSECGLTVNAAATHEPSATFVYEVIKNFGGVEKFYGHFYINSICPLGFTKTNEKGRDVNYNYYDSRELTLAVKDFMVTSLKKQIAMGVYTDVCFCLGTGKNEKFIRELNEQHQFFQKIVPLEHPRYVMQYRAKKKGQYVQKYIDALRSVIPPAPSAPDH